MENGKWKIESGKWKVKSGEFEIDLMAEVW